MLDIWKTLDKFKNTVVASASIVITINDGINVTECIEIALPSSVIREKYLLKK